MSESEEFELKLLKISGELASAFAEECKGDSLKLFTEKVNSIHRELRNKILGEKKFANSNDVITLEIYCIALRSASNCCKQESLMDNMMSLYDDLRKLYDNKPKGGMNVKTIN
ncbi:hypothetical protein H206_06168 [Candidatus Electrothrix aarhusensis]|uniref:Uncharacterized protein n=1 Tax=Candidatus Electrothrix aarhusensis TaxID=1859131 RepID=A0A444J3A6_9BACT|nr:hypothetical protein H206_06168 [Candidatus Electrothrix aarhusensis]